MRALRNTLSRHAAQQGDRPALIGRETTLSFAALSREVDLLAGALRKYQPGMLGLMLDNTPAWAVADLAALETGITQVPIPPFFSPEQVFYAFDNAGIDALLVDRVEQLRPLSEVIPLTAAQIEPVNVAGQPLLLVRFPQATPRRYDSDPAKITYTSGTTGHPKGVCLSQTAMEQVADSLVAATEAGPSDRHLCLAPLAVLLENIAGLYTPLMAGASVLLPGLAETGCGGVFDPARMLGTVSRLEATSIILMPQMLKGLVEQVEQGTPKPAALRFIAVGGAPVSRHLLERAERAGLPVFEGYGLSECASVVALNTPRARRLGSVGKPLPHATVEIGRDGEILAKGAVCSGYLGDFGNPAPGVSPLARVDRSGYLGDFGNPAPDAFWPTGDLGHLDPDGYLFLTGRRKNTFITSFGRNIAPEWVEGALTGHPAIAQAVLFGEGRPWNSAVTHPGTGSMMRSCRPPSMRSTRTCRSTPG